MNGRPDSAAVLAAAAFLVAACPAAGQMATYRTLDAEAHVPSSLRAAPVMLSRSPATFSIAITGDRSRMRTVDMNGRVWQRVLRETGDPMLVIDTQCEPACAALSPDASLVALADLAGGVLVMELDSGQTRLRDVARSERAVALGFSPDGGRLAGVNVRGEVRVWDVRNGSVTREFAVPPGPVQSAAFSPDGGQLAVASYSPEVALVRLDLPGASRDEPQRSTIRIGASRVTALAYTPDAKQLVVAAADGTMRVYDLTGRPEPITLGTHAFAAWSIAFEPGGRRMAAGSWDGTIKLWDTRTWGLMQSVKSHEESVAALTFDKQGGLISAGLDGRLLHWSSDVPRIGSAAVIAGRTDSVWVALYSPDGTTLFIGGRQKRFELWDAVRGELRISREGHPTTRCASFSPDGRMLCTGGDDGTIFLCEASSGKTIRTLLRHPGAVSAVVFVDEGRTLISGCDRGHVKLWDTATGQEKATWRKHNQQIYCANVSPDGKWLITGGGNWTTGDPGELIVWELDTGKVRATLSGHRLAVWTIVFSPDGRRFMSSDSAGAVKIWDLESLQEVRTLQHDMWIRPLALSPDGDTLAVGRGDGSVRLWDTATWTEKACCHGHASFTFWLQYAPGGKTLVSGGNDGTVRFWTAD